MVRPRDANGKRIRQPKGSNLLEVVPKELTAWRPSDFAEACEFASAMLAFAKRDTTLAFTQFYSSRGLLNDEVNQLGSMYPPIARAIMLSKQVIGDRREVGAMKGELEQRITLATLPLYNQEYARQRIDYMKHQALIQSQVSQNNQARVVVIEKAPDSPLVPEKVKPE